MMKASFYVILFASISAFGIWFQQAYMESYSQEFEIERNADRSQGELFSINSIIVRDYQRGLEASSFTGNHARFLNNGHIFASGNLHYVEFDKESHPRLEVHTSTMTGQSEPLGKDKGFLDSSHRMKSFLFPDVVTIKSGEDVIKTKHLVYEPQTGTLETREPFSWNGPSRSMSGVGFRYVMKPGELSINGPIKGNFVPTQQDFKNFVEKR